MYAAAGAVANQVTFELSLIHAFNRRDWPYYVGAPVAVATALALQNKGGGTTRRRA